MTFDEAVSFANETGWRIYQLCQNFQSEGFAWNHWECTLRATEGPPRRQISRGKGHSPEDAITDALANAPEFEAGVTVYSGISPPPTETKALDIFALIGASRPQQAIGRRR